MTAAIASKSRHKEDWIMRHAHMWKGKPLTRDLLDQMAEQMKAEGLYAAATLNMDIRSALRRRITKLDPSVKVEG